MKRFASYISSFILVPFILGTVAPPSFALEALMPAAGQMVEPSRAWSPCVLRGLKYFPEDPFRYDFFIDSGDLGLSGPSLKDESTKLIKYFLASLTAPFFHLSLNLSPYEKERIIPDGFGLTEMGRDLLEQDYLLKQFTAYINHREEPTTTGFEPVSHKYFSGGVDSSSVVLPGKFIPYNDSFQGLTPVILDIRPMSSIRILLGLGMSNDIKG